MTTITKENKMTTKTGVEAALSIIGERYGYSDDSWPDMVDAMVVMLVDDYGMSNSTAERIVDEFVNSL